MNGQPQQPFRNACFLLLDGDASLLVQNWPISSTMSVSVRIRRVCFHFFFFFFFFDKGRFVCNRNKKKEVLSNDDVKLFL